MTIPGTGWKHVPGSATDIAVSPEGSVFHVSGNLTSRRHIFLWDGKEGWTQTGMETNNRWSISGGPNNSVYFVGLYGGLHRWSTSRGHEDLGIPLFVEHTSDISVGPDGVPWYVFKPRESFPFPKPRLASKGHWYDSIRHWNHKKKDWEPLALDSATRISSGGKKVWALTEDNGAIWICEGRLRQVPGYATDIAAGLDGSAWHVGRNGDIYYGDENGWSQVGGNAAMIAVGSDGLAWHVNAKGEIFRRI